MLDYDREAALVILGEPWDRQDEGAHNLNVLIMNQATNARSGCYKRPIYACHSFNHSELDFYCMRWEFGRNLHRETWVDTSET